MGGAIALAFLGAAVMRGVARLLGLRARFVGPRVDLEDGQGVRAVVARASAPLAIVFLPWALATSFVYLHGGQEEVRSPLVVDTVVDGSPAETAGIEPGDVILEVEGDEVADIDAYREALAERADVATRVVVERDGSRRALTVVPMRRAEGVISGIRPRLRYRRADVGLAAAIAIPWEYAAMQWSALATRGSRLAGPVGILRTMSSASDPWLVLFVTFCGIAAVSPLVALVSALDQIRLALVKRRGR